MLRRATLLMLLLPGMALGQTVSGTVTATASSQGQASRAECQSTTATAAWTIASSGLTLSAGDKWRLQTASSGGCSTTVPTSGFLTDQLATNTTQVVSGIFVKDMATQASASCTSADDTAISLCVYYLPLGQVPSTTVVITGTFNFQTAIPPAPVITGVTPGDSRLTVAVVPGTATATEKASTGVTYTITCSAPGATSSTATSSAGNISCGGLTNGLAYTVTAVGNSAAGNQGPVSATWPAGTDTTPLPFEDFWNTYKAAGGVEQGGCGTGGAGALAPALAIVALLAARRRRP